ncbi:hypothetical protein A3A71_02295 [Candidatus Berkelbacteria bacterium RIFCSPLOWO2_01_FULL_50_28]|uniref:SpoVT-AbrB domain-containing protein n=1 Tax=Candidatus Berkelbacteria bacterium RIFCSPLOWO2_01_FULL_50_28 TaxID=1797471 RepID=A0A1F5ECB1_9BACT|nr:MAG: hypothetical protein A2807_00690 [Candidatus Berkelbacteria bacterium RIFCSPHIGHO2_01_FULL_50_36]OGD62212.1 MAG: hypothetical protein A3F39_00710 [Candidatus Berkelbacteria bacterium RIFCSPHIGHO2_12_FULL_50_11]OGD64854.1 MAG: hypothetical protein A3A71_02295 [Candidatus Berkelbacteria bacterium RIFCSPLOWO2_01_FULL_50_28]
MRIHSTRKLFLFGRYSLALLIPKKWLVALEVNRGDGVELALDRKRRRIVLRFGKTPTTPVNNPPKEDTPKDGLEPIPRLD